MASFLNPWETLREAASSLYNRLLPSAAEGLKGVGLGESKQKLLFLPETHTDFIFSLVGEELGLIGAGVIILLFVMLFVRGIATTNRAKDSFVYYLSFGLSIMIALQALINFSVVTGMIPTKGLPLPFISYGAQLCL